MDARKLLAELIGTFVFFLIGFMSILATNAVSSTIDLVVIAFGFGLGLFAAIQIAGTVSGGHFNPAVTIGALLDKRIDPMNAVGYLIAQLIGGLGAAGLVLLVSSQAVVAGDPDDARHRHQRPPGRWSSRSCSRRSSWPSS